MMALQGLSLSQPRMRADTHDGPEQIAPLQRSDTLMQLSRSLSWKSILYRTAGPYIWHFSAVHCRSLHGRFREQNRTFSDAYSITSRVATKFAH